MTGQRPPRKERRHAQRERLKERHDAEFWIRLLTEQDEQEPEYHEFCAREFYGVSREEVLERTVRTIREKVGDGSINIEDLMKLVSDVEGKSPAQYRAQRDLCRKMFADREAATS